MRYNSILYIKIAQLCLLHVVYFTSFQFHSVLSYLKDGYWSMSTPSVLSENKLFDNKSNFYFGDNWCTVFHSTDNLLLELFSQAPQKYLEKKMLTSDSSWLNVLFTSCRTATDLIYGIVISLVYI